MSTLDHAGWAAPRPHLSPSPHLLSHVPSCRVHVPSQHHILPARELLQVTRCLLFPSATEIKEGSSLNSPFGLKVSGGAQCSRCSSLHCSVLGKRRGLGIPEVCIAPTHEHKVGKLQDAKPQEYWGTLVIGRKVVGMDA